MLKKKVDGLEEYYYQWMNKYKDDADRRGELLKDIMSNAEQFIDAIKNGDNKKAHTYMLMLEICIQKIEKELADAKK